MCDQDIVARRARPGALSPPDRGAPREGAVPQVRQGLLDAEGDPQLSTNTLPEDPVYVFCPEPKSDDDAPRRILILLEDTTVAVSTALVALTLADGIRLCDRLNRRLGFDNATWTAVAARFARLAAGHAGALH